MGRVRPFTPNDIDEIATLHREGFLRGVLDEPSADHHSYFQAVFFDNPWRDTGLPSLVFEDDSGSLEGFLGVVPRRLRLGDEPIVAAVSTQFLVRPESRSTLAGFELMRVFLNGDQDLSIADEGNDYSRKIWERLGGSTLLLPSVSWSKALRPARHFNARVQARRGLSWSRVLRPFADVADALANAPASPLSLRRPAGVVSSPLAVSELHEWLHDRKPAPKIRSDYTPEALTWLLDRYDHGPWKLVQRSVRTEAGAWKGCYLYCHKPDGLAEVLYHGSAPGGEQAVFDAMVLDAHQTGATLLWGKLTPDLIRPLSVARCAFHNVQRWSLVATKRPDLDSVLRDGRTVLTRLEGEYPTAFHI